MIKQLQLRGISRTPSDRMTADGGCAESLNIHLEDGESAPTLPAKILNDGAGTDLPDYDSGEDFEIVYIHKQYDYTNYICKKVESGVIKIGIYSSGEFIPIAQLSSGETLKSVTGIGNTIIAYSDRYPYYMLYKEGAYKFLGNKIPSPAISIATSDLVAERGWDLQPELRTRYQVDGATSLDDDRVAEGIMYAWNLHRKARGLDCDFFIPTFIRCATLLYDRTFSMASIPVLVASGKKLNPDVYLIRSNNTIYACIGTNVCSVTAYLYNKAELDEWSDIIAGFDFFASEPIMNPSLSIDTPPIIKGYSADSEHTTSGIEYFNVELESQYNTREVLLSKSQFYRIASVRYELSSLYDDDRTYSVQDATQGIRLYSYRDVADLVLNKELPDDYDSNNITIGNNPVIYNQRLFIGNVSQRITPGFMAFHAPFSAEVEEANRRVRFEFKFFVKPISSLASNDSLTSDNDAYIRSLFYDGGYEFTPRSFTIYGEGGSARTAYERFMGWIAYPHPNCTLAIVKVTAPPPSGSGADQTWVRAIEMSKHDNLSISYAFWGIDKFLDETIGREATTAEIQLFNQEKPYINFPNKLFYSLESNPFIFPLSNRLTFDSAVLGCAIATKALSEGQFGQFPIYISTQEGIYAAEISDEGMALNARPVSRDVAIEGSLTSIEQAIVFITNNAVMVLSGSDVTNISPDMNGRHYVLETDIQQLLSTDSDWSELLPSSTDNTPFMAFMRSAEIAYDYKGARLIFFNDTKPYQYIYVFGTQTWHKVMGGEGNYRRLNSYPECEISRVWQVEQETDEVDVTVESIDGDYSQRVADALAAWLNEHDVTVSSDVFYNLPATVRMSNELSEMFYDEIDSCDSDWDCDTDYSTSAVTIFVKRSALLDYSTVLEDASVLSDTASPVRGMIVTRPFDLGAPDVRKTIKSIRIRGQYNLNDVKYILCGSMNGINWQRLTSLRGGSYKLFRLVVLANLSPTERISWIDVDFDTRFTNKLR